MDKQWLCASYHFPSVYSCRVPMSSISSAQVLPAPGPATVCFALIRTALEFYERQYVRKTLFPALIACDIRIRPPERVAFSLYPLRAYKSNVDSHIESIVYREFAYTDSIIKIALNVPVELISPIEYLLRQIPYWGQGNSLTTCIDVQYDTLLVDYAVPLGNLLLTKTGLSAHYHTYVTTFKKKDWTWPELIEGNCKTSPLQINLYVWPLRVIEQHSTHLLLERCSLEV